MNGLRRLLTLAMPSGDDYGIARVVVAVRVAVMLSVVVLVATGPDFLRQHVVAVYLALLIGFIYAGVMIAYPRLEVRRTRYAWLGSALDSTLGLTLVGLTGGAASPIVLVFALIVISSAARLTFFECLALAGGVGIAYLVLVQVVDTPDDPAMPAWALGVWWTVYLLFGAVLSGGLATLFEREQRDRLRALVEAEAEHAAAEEERDLRRRLLASYQAQQEGLQVLLHEFRTPVASLDALATALSSSTSLNAGDRQDAITLARRHARHLSDMLNSLSDVNLSRQPAFSSGRIRRVDLRDLIAEAGDAAGVQPPRLQIHLADDAATFQADAQGLRRILTNLLENAARHGRGLPIDVVCKRSGSRLEIAVLDRGPGVAREQMRDLTTKFVSLSDRRGTAGLGLWIVAQIVDALGGTLEFTARDEGGLAATVTVPVNWPGPR